jgi:hypothetical protein
MKMQKAQTLKLIMPESQRQRKKFSNIESRKEYKIIRISKEDNSCNELGIIIAKKRLKDVPTTGFIVVHIEPDGLIDRLVHSHLFSL